MIDVSHRKSVVIIVIIISSCWWLLLLQLLFNYHLQITVQYTTSPWRNSIFNQGRVTRMLRLNLNTQTDNQVNRCSLTVLNVNRQLADNHMTDKHLICRVLTDVIAELKHQLTRRYSYFFDTIV